tara:strand:+ start:230 stop:1717 length:1488 start_codon:yes stop_codon:yes gene_type:complete
MADTIYTVTVASGNLYGGGTGNVYYLNGVRNSTGPGTVSWVQGATLRFEQSDASNDGHPLIFSSTTSRDNYLTSGVTYYLDGSVTYGNYVNTTTFNAATTRYVEVTPSSQTDFYYLCYVHGIGMGGIFDITSNTWGALQWGQGSWAAQGDAGFTVTGISSTSSVGSVSASGVVEIGWGGDTWGENEWGDLSGSQPTITGQQLTSSIGSESVSANADVDVSGIQLTSTQGAAIGGTSALVEITGSLESMGIGQVQIGIGAIASGISMSSSIGAATVDETTLTGEGWGRGEWGEFAWGDNFSVQLTGQSLTSSIGNETAFTDVTVAVSGSQASFTQGSFSLQIDGDVTVLAAEDQLDITNGGVSSATGVATVDIVGLSITSSQGNTVGGLKTPVDVNGISMTISQGNTSLVQTTVESVSGQQATMSLGSHAEIPSQIVGVSGLSLTSSLGEEGITGDGEISLTGQSLTSSIGSVNITAWSEIDLGVSNTWTVVDLAA